jgi:thiosulfate/3-mercaptopyruvate sulfurtransferase
MPCWSDARLRHARAPERFSGQQEPIDPVAGHIPGACNLHFADNLDGEGHFLPVETLERRFRDVLGDTPPQDVVHMCGSGVTACHNLFAMELAGMEGSTLFPASWSGWIADGSRPVAGSREEQ